MKLTDEDYKLIGADIGGTFHHEEGTLLVFGSNSFPSYRITVERAEAEKAIKAHRKRAYIETTDEHNVVAKIFRLFTRDGTGACTRDLWVRFDYTGKGWVVSFYKRHGMRDAIEASDKLTEVPADVADLAQEAFRRLDLLNKSGKTGCEALSFEP